MLAVSPCASAADSNALVGIHFWGERTDSAPATLLGNLAYPQFARSLITPQVGAVFHLASLVSGGAEQNFELGTKVNLDATRDLLEACRSYPGVSNARRITFEYVMLKGVNDSDADARNLVKVLSGVKAKVNLLPLNEAAGIPFRRPGDERVDAFAKVLADRDTVKRKMDVVDEQIDTVSRAVLLSPKTVWNGLPRPAAATIPA